MFDFFRKKFQKHEDERKETLQVESQKECQDGRANDNLHERLHEQLDERSSERTALDRDALHSKDDISGSALSGASSSALDDVPSSGAPTPTGTTSSAAGGSSRFSAWRKLLSKTGQRITRGIGKLFGVTIGAGGLDAAGWQTLEDQLLSADLGVAVVKKIITDLKKRKPSTLEQAVSCLRTSLLQILQPCERPVTWGNNGLETVLVVGVNGAGKTTTIGKLAYFFKQQGRRVMLAAGDTFRAAAVEQLQIWGERNNIPVVAQHGKADSAAVIYDAMQSAQAKGCDLMLADTAGRLHTQHDFMQELSKIRRVMGKFSSEAPHHVLLVLDATIGQNAMQQAEEFNNSAGITGLCITKLDGTAKGGAVFAIAQRFNLPIYFLGMGEQIDQLYPFNAEKFVDALLGDLVAAGDKDSDQTGDYAGKQ